MISNLLGLGLKGIQSGLAGIAQKADRISKAFTPENPNDLTGDIVGMKMDEFQVKASAKTIKTAEELQDSVLDILA